MSKTLENLLDLRRWIAHIDDERELGNSIIVTLAKGWEFADERVKAGTNKSSVVQQIIHLSFGKKS